MDKDLKMLEALFEQPELKTFPLETAAAPESAPKKRSLESDALSKCFKPRKVASVVDAEELKKQRQNQMHKFYLWNAEEHDMDDEHIALTAQTCELLSSTPYMGALENGGNKSSGAVGPTKQSGNLTKCQAPIEKLYVMQDAHGFNEYKLREHYMELIAIYEDWIKENLPKTNYTCAGNAPVAVTSWKFKDEKQRDQFYNLVSALFKKRPQNMRRGNDLTLKNEKKKDFQQVRRFLSELGIKRPPGSRQRQVYLEYYIDRDAWNKNAWRLTAARNYPRPKICPIKPKEENP